MELSKVNAPSLMLHEFNYYFNKAVRQYTNKRYNLYDVNQLTTDDLRVLKAEARLDPHEVKSDEYKLFGATYYVTLPDDYLHMLNCICIYELLESDRCYDKGNHVAFSATRLTSDSWSVLINDYYNRPLPERPYYYIHNVNQSEDLPTNKFSESIPGSTDLVYIQTELDGEEAISEYPRVITIAGLDELSAIEKPTASRHANPSKVRLEIRYGNDRSVYKLVLVRIDYIKAPLIVRLTLEQVDLTKDTSLIMEFPDYVCQEIINELVVLVMQRDADPRLQTLVAVTLSIANPAQQLAQPTLK